ncbi:CRIB domain-containing protein RIC7 [Humulus lupulus]|uniref:CRIB domain-containing protein RIC7 n=1 Tax=Humulus lupulus TaxID=3486 RepID=UPI002B40102C|nr:CRIB domain-containing protein RIC7 [Humulus lupulus]
MQPLPLILLFSKRVFCFFIYLTCTQARRKMTTKVKGLLKGLRYISQIFDEKEEEIQIGFPTDVKHVAHIGWDGPSANNGPSWMSEFRTPTEVSSGPLEATGPMNSQQGTQDPLTQNENTKSRRHHSSNLGGSEASSPTKRGPSSEGKHSRRRRSTTDASASSPARDSSGSSRHSRRQHKSNLGVDSAGQDQPAIPRSSRRKKGSSSTEGSSTRSSRSKGHHSLTDTQYSDLGTESETGLELKNNEEQVRRE